MPRSTPSQHRNRRTPMDADKLDFKTIPRKGPKCLECRLRARIGTGAETYPGEPHLHDQPMWVCTCGAYARCKAGTFTPIGLPASRETRQIQHEAGQKHREYCRIIQSSGRSASAAKSRAKKDYKQATGSQRLVFQAMSKGVALRALGVFSRFPPCLRTDCAA